MEKVNILVIGAGAVGLAVANELSADFEDLVVVEQENSFGRHTSSRNSEVIHSGIYYPQNTLKAKLCVEGNTLLYNYCKDNDIPFLNCGKIVVAANKDETSELEKLMQNGIENGVKGLKIISDTECHQLEPTIKAEAGLWVPSTGILSTHEFMHSLANKTEDNDGFIVYDMQVTGIDKNADGFLVEFKNGEEFLAKTVINCAGLFSEQIAKLAGIDTIKKNLQIHWCKGEYYKCSKIKGVKHLVYPLPDPNGVFLGIHLTINLDGEVRFGPNAYYVDDLDYKISGNYEDDFYNAVAQYIDVDREFFTPDDAGIRPKLQAKGEGFRDFHISLEPELPGFINLTGIESPGLTASLSIAKKVKELFKQS